MEYKIKEYEYKYKEKTIQLLINVAVHEYGFTEWKKWFKLFENENYKYNKGNCWVALNNQDQVIGTISLKNIDNFSAEIKNMYVQKDYRGKGIAQNLLDTLIRFATQNGYERLQLDTYDNFQRAIKFYQKNYFYLEKSLENKYIYYRMLYRKKISVIVPIYNIEKYVENCIKSIIEQKYENLQIILIDDGSTDNSAKICDMYANIDKRIEVVHKTNEGLAQARNDGIKLAKGEYISFVDGDDYICPSFYADLFYIIEKYQADISECQFLRIKEEDINQAEEIINKYNDTINIEQEVCDNEQSLQLLYGTRLQPYVKKVVVWNKLYKKEIWEDIVFPKGKLHEDEYTTHKVLNKCKKIVSTNKVLHGYIQTNNSIMRTEIKQKRIDDNLDAYIKSAQFFKDNKNEKVEMLCRRKYLEYCIELSGKVMKSKNQEKEKQLKQIQSLFIDYYEKHIENIEKTHKDTRELRIIDLINRSYKEAQEKYVGSYWDELEKIINEI